MCDLDIKKDWDGVDFKSIKDAVCVFHEFYEYPELIDFVNKMELLRDKQIKAATKNIPSLLKKEN